MADDIVTRLREHHGSFRMAVGVNDAFILETIYGEAADEIERLREWAAYEHAGYCGCAGGDKECLNRAYTTWRKMFDE